MISIEKINCENKNSSNIHNLFFYINMLITIYIYIFFYLFINYNYDL